MSEVEDLKKEIVALQNQRNFLEMKLRNVKDAIRETIDHYNNGREKPNFFVRRQMENLQMIIDTRFGTQFFEKEPKPHAKFKNG